MLLLLFLNQLYNSISNQVSRKAKEGFNKLDKIALVIRALTRIFSLHYLFEYNFIGVVGSG